MNHLAVHPIVIIGAGAAGLMAALWAAGGPHPVLLLEGGEHPGKKILISGGGRCNVLPSRAAPEDFVTDGSRNTLAKILRGVAAGGRSAFLRGGPGDSAAARKRRTASSFPSLTGRKMCSMPC